MVEPGFTTEPSVSRAHVHIWGTPLPCSSSSFVSTSLLPVQIILKVLITMVTEGKERRGQIKHWFSDYIVIYVNNLRKSTQRLSGLIRVFTNVTRHRLSLPTLNLLLPTRIIWRESCLKVDTRKNWHIAIKTMRNLVKCKLLKGTKEDLD